MFLKANICQNTASFWHLLGIFIIVLKILIPIIIIITGTIPVFNVLIKGNAEEAKKAGITLIKKIIAGIIIFFIPTAIDSLIQLLTNNNLIEDDTQICSACLYTPNDEKCMDYVTAAYESDEEDDQISDIELQEILKGEVKTSDLKGYQKSDVSSQKGSSGTSNNNYKYLNADNLPFNLEHAIKVHDNIHRSENGNLKWQARTINHKGGTIGAYTEVINIFNEKDYRIYEIYNTLVKAHPEFITKHREPYKYEDMNSLYNFTVTYAPATIDEVNKALSAGKLVQLQVHSNKWRNEKGELVSWPGYHTGLIFYFDGTHYHMKAAGKINQSDAIYTESQLIDWIGNTSKKLIIYTKNS